MAGGLLQLGDTTYTKVFVGGLAWETQKETMKKHFEEFGEILEAVVITDKASGRSKGYGFVTFREAEAARRACVDPTPVIDGRRANCNLASLGLQRSKPSTPNHGGKIKNVRVMMGRMQSGFGAPPPSLTFSHYPHHLPLNLFRYSPYSPVSSYPTSLYGVYGYDSGGQYGYGVYGNGNRNGAGLTAEAAPFYPCGGGSNGGGVHFSQASPFNYHYNTPAISLPPALQPGMISLPLHEPVPIPYR